MPLHRRFLFPLNINNNQLRTVHSADADEGEFRQSGEKDRCDISACTGYLKPIASLPTGLTLSPILASPIYRHYDVAVGWDEDQIDTDIWSKDVRRFTRLHYARYGNGPPGKTPWRGASLEASLKNNHLDGEANDCKTFLTETHIVHTPKCIWEQYASVPLEDLFLKELAEWVAELQPRSIHDLKPLLLLCQGLLKDALSEKVDLASREVERENDMWLAEKQEIIAEYGKVVEGLQSEIERLSKSHETSSKAAKLIGRASAFTHNLMVDASRRKLNDKTISFSEAQRKIKIQCEQQQHCIEDLKLQLEALRSENAELDKSNEALRTEVDVLKEDVAKSLVVQRSSITENVQIYEDTIVTAIGVDEAKNQDVEFNEEKDLNKVGDDNPGTKESMGSQEKKKMQTVRKTKWLRKETERPPEISEAQTEDTVVAGVSKMVEDMFENVEGVVFFVEPQPGRYPEFTLSYKKFGRASSMCKESMGILEEVAAKAVYSRKITGHKGYIAVPIQGSNELPTAVIVVAEESLPTSTKNQFGAYSFHPEKEEDQSVDSPQIMEAEAVIISEEPAKNTHEIRQPLSMGNLSREMSMEWRFPGMEEVQGKTYLPPLSKSAVRDANIVSKNVQMHADLSNTKFSGVVRSQGNVLGFLTPMGMVVSENGKVVGRVETDGSLRSFTGTVYEEVATSHEKVVRTNGGFPVGYVDESGEVRNVHDKVIGVEVENGCALNHSGELLGWVDPHSVPSQGSAAKKPKTEHTRFKGIVKNENGDTAGFITTSNILIDSNGASIGTASSKGTLHMLFGNMNQATCWEACNVVRSLDGYPLGYMNDLGDAVGLSGEIFGIQGAGRSVVNKNGDEIGWIDSESEEQDIHSNMDNTGQTPWVPDKFVVGESGNIIGRVRADGQVVHVHNETVEAIDSLTILGKLNENGIAIDSKGNPLGKSGNLTANGQIIDNLGRKLLKISSLGKQVQKVDMHREDLIGVALSNQGEAMGVITASGLALSITGEVLGPFDPTTTKITGKEDIHVRMTEVLKDSSGAAAAYYNTVGDLVHLDKLQEDRHDNEPEWRRDMSTLTCLASGKPEYEWTPQGPGLLADMEGNTIGFVGSNGVARDLQGVVVGKANGDCSVTNKEDLVIGLFVEVVPVRDESECISGYTFVDGQPVSEEANSVDTALDTIVQGSSMLQGECIPSPKGHDSDLQCKGPSPTPDSAEPETSKDSDVVAADNLMHKNMHQTKSSNQAQQELLHEESHSIGMDIRAEVYPWNSQEITYLPRPTINIVDDKGEVVGVLGADGIPTDMYGKPVGKVVDNQVVESQDGSIFGSLEGTDTLIDKQGRSVGKVVDRSVVRDDGGKVVGIQAGSLICDLKGNHIGTCMNREPVDKAGNPLGQILPVKLFTSMEGTPIGFVDDSGDLTDFEGNNLGKVHGNSPLKDCMSKFSKDKGGRRISCASRTGTEDKEVQVCIPGMPNIIDSSQGSQLQAEGKKKGEALAMLQRISELAMHRMKEITLEREKEMNMLGEEISRLDTKAQMNINQQHKPGVLKRFKKAGAAAMFAKKLMSFDNTKKRLLTEMEHLQDLRQKVLKQLCGKHITKSFVELRTYRRPPQAVAIAISCTMILLGEKNCHRLRDDALSMIPFPSNAQYLTNIWIELKSHMTPELPKKMQDVDTTGDDESTVIDCQAVEYIINQLSNEKASRVSQCVVLLRNWIELMLHIFHASQDFRNFMSEDGSGGN